MLKMLSNILSNLFSKPATRRYPFEKRENFRDSRWSIKFDKEGCIFCGLCARRCPAAAIVVDRQAKTLTFDHFKCIVCDYCVEGCPKKIIHHEEQYRSPGVVKTSETLKGEVEAKPEVKAEA
jgi:formate hydrogenlyase subunit 6/NADH:ubiquinone oxidoreductase subunit I